MKITAMVASFAIAIGALASGCSSGPPFQSPAPTVTETPSTVTVTVPAPVTITPTTSLAPAADPALPPIDPNDLFRPDKSDCQSNLRASIGHVDDYTSCMRSIVVQMQRLNRAGREVQLGADGFGMSDYLASECNGDLTGANEDLGICYGTMLSWLVNATPLTLKIDKSTATPVGAPLCRTDLTFFATHIDEYVGCISDLVNEVQRRELASVRVPSSVDGTGIVPGVGYTNVDACKKVMASETDVELGTCLDRMESWLATSGAF